MVKVEVCQDNVADISRFKPQPPYLIQRSEALIELNVVEHTKEPAQALGVLDIVVAETSVDQHQAVMLRFNQQAVARHLGCKPVAVAVKQRTAKRAHAPAVQMMDDHRDTPMA